MQYGGLYSVGSGSPTEDWGKWSPSIAKASFPFLCTAVAIFLAVLLYTLTQPLIAKIYTPDSAIASLRSQQQVYMPYMTACSDFDPPTHYGIYIYKIAIELTGVGLTHAHPNQTSHWKLVAMTVVVMCILLFT